MISILEEKMRQAAKNLDFEEAATLRDKISSMKGMLERQIVSASTIDQDYIAVAKEEDLSCVQVFFVRGGKVVGRENFIFDKSRNSQAEEIISSFIKQFYMRV